jgi:Ca-activated chloride channel family protein
MEFAAPLNALLAIPVALVFLLRLRGERRRAALLARFAELHLLRRLVRPQHRWARAASFGIPTLVLFLLVLALMRPQWGVVEEERSQSGIDLVFALDLSRSMLADDLPPSRLAVAKRAVAETLASLTADRVGIVAFAGTAFLVCPLTSDHELAGRILADLGTETLPRGGSSLASALREGIRALRGSASGGKVLVVLSDGEDHAGGIDEAVAELQKEGVTVLGFVIGTASGALMPLGDGRFVKDGGGAVVKSRGDLTTLRRIDPAAVPLTDATAAAGRIARLRASLRESRKTERRRHLAERFYLPLGCALFLWSGALLLPRLWGKK